MTHLLLNHRSLIQFQLFSVLDLHWLYFHHYDSIRLNQLELNCQVHIEFNYHHL